MRLITVFDFHGNELELLSSILFSSDVFEALVKEHLPDLFGHLEGLGVLSMITLSWFLTLFLRYNC